MFTIPRPGECYDEGAEEDGAEHEHRDAGGLSVAADRHVAALVQVPLAVHRAGLT